jgi:hypothetical protein
MKTRQITKKEWEEEGTKKFGDDMMKWKFVCPACGHIASIQDWRDIGADEGEVAFSCVGRHVENHGTLFDKGQKQPCNYAGGGFFTMNPVHVEMDNGDIRQTFEFAE